MEKTKETKKEGEKKKLTFGEKIFMSLILICIFLIAVLFYTFYLAK